MRLIDADKLIMALNDYALTEAPDERECAGERRISSAVYSAIQNCMKAVEEQPTAFDVEKVTDEILRANPEVYGDMDVVPVNFGQRIKHKRFYDSTTYMMGVVRDMIQPFDEEGKPRKPQLILPNDNDMVGQLSCRKYDFVETRQKVESKAEMKKRGLSSPDEADSVLLAVLPVKLKKRGEKK